MNNLDYYLARKRGFDPDEAADMAGGRDPLPDTPDAGPDIASPAPPPPADQPAAQPPAPAPAGPPPPMPPPAAPGFSQRLSDALMRSRQRAPMPEAFNDKALAASMQADEDDTRREKLSEMLRAAFSRSAPNLSGIRGGPSAATQALQLQRQTFDKQQADNQAQALKEAQLLKAAEPKPLDPSLAALHEASALNLRGLEQQRALEETRKTDETKRKAEESARARSAEDASLESQRAILAADPRLKRLGITRETLDKLDRKGIEDVQRELQGKYGAGSPSARGGGGGKTLAASALKELGDLDAADTQLAKLEQTAAGSHLNSFKNQAVSMLPEKGFMGINKANTEIGRFEDSARAAMQGVGTILEHGKLAAGDEGKYKRMLPEPGDDAATLHHKISELRGYLKELKSRHVDAYEQGGYRVPKTGGSKPPVRDRALELKKQGLTSQQIADKLNEEGY